MLLDKVCHNCYSCVATLSCEECGISFCSSCADVDSLCPICSPKLKKVVPILKCSTCPDEAVYQYSETKFLACQSCIDTTHTYRKL